MATRRPRLKPVANILLNSKRKAKLIHNADSTNDLQNDAVDISANTVPVNEKCINTTENIAEVTVEYSVETNEDILCRSSAGGNENNDMGASDLEFQNIDKDHMNQRKNENDEREKSLTNNSKNEVMKNAFKCPPEVAFQRTVSHISNSGIEDVFYSDIEENALHIDSEDPPANGCSMSPFKNLARQRIRPTPHFGQRRNSFVGSSPSHAAANEDSNVNNDLVETTRTKRERYHSGSFAANMYSPSHHKTAHKYFPSGIPNSNTVRIRTDSGCSILSDKIRKVEDHKHSFHKDLESKKIQQTNTLKMFDFIYYNPNTNPMEQKPKLTAKLEQTVNLHKDTKPFTADEGNNTDNEAVPVPQLKLNAKGELILDDTSLVIETTAEQEARKVLANSSLVYLDEYTGMNGFYSRKKRTRNWDPSETIKFYRCLQNIGTDFSLMVSLFPNRTRRDLKLKFKKEERKNSHLINKALVYPKQFDIESLKQQLNEEEKMADQQKIDKKKIKKSRKRKDCNVKSKANRILINGDNVYQNEMNQKNQETKRGHKTMNKNRSGNIAQNDNENTGRINAALEITRCEEIINNKTEDKLKLKKRIKNGSKLLSGDEIIIKNNSVNNEKMSPDAIDNNTIDNILHANPTNKAQNEETIKEEIIKMENKQESNQTTASIEYQETNQLQTEINELLDMDTIEIQYNKNSSQTANTNVFASNFQYGEQNQESIVVTSTESHTINTGNYTDHDISITDDERRISVNKHDSPTNVYSNIKEDFIFVASSTGALGTLPNRSQSTDFVSPLPGTRIENENDSSKSGINEVDINNDIGSNAMSERELSEADIQSILTELAEGSLVLVSTLDPDDPDKVLNEIYMLDKNTGDLCDEPLSIPENIVRCILTVVS